MFDRTRVKFGQAVCHSQSSSAASRDFFDREPESDQAYTLLTSGTTKAVIVLGGRRSGKTSEIKHLGTRLSSNARNHCEFIEIPWGGIREQKELAQEIQQGIRIHIRKRLGGAALNNIQSSNPDTLGAFLENLRELLAIIPETHLVLAIDEFDSILESARESRSLEEAGKIIGLANTLVEDSTLSMSLLLTMARIPDLISGTRSSPLVSKSRLITLRPFPKPDMDQMIQSIVLNEHPITDSDLNAIYELSGGWPYFAKLMLECLADLPSDTSQIQAALQLAVQHEAASQTIANIYDVHFSDDEKRLALFLAARHGKLTAGELAMAGTTIQTAALQLAARDIVHMEPQGGCRFRIGLLEPWFRNWVRYDLEVERYISDLILDSRGDPFLGSTPVIVTDQDLENYLKVN